MTRMLLLVAAVLAVLGLSSSEVFGQTSNRLFSAAGTDQISASSSLVGNAIGFVVHLAGKDIIYLWEGHDGYPIAKRTNDPWIVISPYAPYNRVVVHGIRSGELAMDPSVGKAFIWP